MEVSIRDLKPHAWILGHQLGPKTQFRGQTAHKALQIMKLPRETVKHGVKAHPCLILGKC